MKRTILFLSALVLMHLATLAQRIIQPAGRGVVAVDRTWNSQTRFGEAGKLISWRKLAAEPEGTTYNVYKRAYGTTSWTKMNSTPLKKTNYTPSNLSNNTEYAVTAIVNGVESPQSTPFLYKTQAWPNVWFNFDFDNKVIARNDYRTKFVWPMDLDGNGEVDAVVVDRLYAGVSSDDAENAGDVDLTTSHKIQGYKLDGTLLWTVDIGPNINICGGQNDMVLAYDINCDGKCEVIIRSSDGTRFWDKANETWGKYANGSTTGDTDGDGIIDYSKQSTKLPPFYISVIDGATGAEIDCNELRYSEVTDGSDTWTRNSRAKYMSFGYATLEGHFSIYYLDDIHPSLVMECLDRDNNKTHHNYVFSWDYEWKNGVPSNWHHSSTWSRNDKSPWPAEFHQLRVADVDGDGFDEMCQGGYSVNPLKGTFHSAGIGHGDRWILSDINPDRPGMECYAIQQSALLGQLIYDPATGERLKEWYLPSVYDVGRGACMDIDPNHKGYEIYSFTDDYLYDCEGTPTGETRTQWGIKTMFEGVWWNEDLLREELSSPGGSGYGTNMMITTVRGKGRLIEFSQESSWATHGGTGTRPAFMGDITGDWREEVILAKQNESSSTGLTGYTTAIPTNYSIYCLQQDPHYRLDCTTRGYYQHPNTSFYLGVGMPMPPLPPVMETDLRYREGDWSIGATCFTSFDQKQAQAYADGKSVVFDVSGNNSNTISISGNIKPAATYFMNPLKHDYVLEGNIAGGAVYKSLLGTTTLNGDITSTDSLIISEGMLVVNGTIAAPLALRAKGTLGGNATLTGGTVFEGGLNYEGCRLSPGTKEAPFGIITSNTSMTLSGDVFVEMNLQTQDEVKCDLVKVNGDLTFKKTNTFTIVPVENVPAEGEYVLMECTGTLTADVKNIKVRGLVGLNYAIEAREKQIVLVIRGMRDPATNVRWTGVEDSNWDYQTANFSLNDEATSFVTNDEVIFPEEATRRTVTLTDKMVTNGVRFTHNSGTYTFNGEGGFSGEGNFVMDGTGTVVLNATKSNYTGKTILNSGSVTVKNLENKDTESCFGAGSTIEIGKATLTVNHTNAATNRNVVLTDSASINVPANSTTTLQSALTGKGVLVKKGAGQLNLNYGGTNGYAGTVLVAGTLSQGAWNATIGKAGSTIDVKGNASFRIFNNNSTSAVPAITNTINIQKGKTLTIDGGQRCKMQGKLTGEGTMKISFPYVRGDFETNCSAFEGTLNPTSGQFRISNTLDLSKGTFEPGAGVYVANVKSQSGTEESRTNKIGALKGTAADASFGTGVWNVGYLGTSTTFAGKFNSSATLNKYGDGVLTLTGASEAAINIYGGEILAQNTSASTTTGTITVRNGGRLAGTGQAKNVSVQNGGTLGAGKSTTTVGTLTLNGTLTMAAGSTLRVRTRSTATSTTCDAFKVAGNVKLTSPTIDLTEQLNSNYTYEDGTELHLFTGTGTITLNGEVTLLPETPRPGYLWDTSALASDGIIRIIADPVGIRELSADQLTEHDIICDMAGRRIKTITHSGSYIINGIKVYIRK